MGNSLTEKIKKTIFQDTTPLQDFKSFFRNLLNPFFTFRLLIGGSFFLTGVFFFFINVYYFLIELINVIYDDRHWYVSTLAYMDRLLIALTIFVIGEKILLASIFAHLKTVPIGKSRFTVEFDKTVASMVVITAAISFLNIILAKESANNILANGLGIGIIIIAIGLWSYLERQSKSEE